jgi:hypothetical protein
VSRSGSCFSRWLGLSAAFTTPLCHIPLSRA